MTRIRQRHEDAPEATIRATTARDGRRRRWPLRSLGAVVSWIRAGYADDAPVHGHSTLIALCGPVSLTADEIDRVVTYLTSASGPARPAWVDVEVAICKVADRLPTRRQVEGVLRVLDDRRRSAD